MYREPRVNGTKVRTLAGPVLAKSNPLFAEIKYR